jgi:Transcriptional regulator
MIRLEDVTLFVRSAALGSFSRAAREVNLLPGQVSAAILRLERELDRRLFARSTRSLRLTAEGEKYLPYAQEMLALMQAGADSLQSHEDALSGG